MRRKELDLDIADADADGLADGNSSASTTVTLDGALTSGGTYTSADGMGKIIIITDAGADDQSTATYTLTGTNANDETITEDITGPGSGATVASTKFYKTVTSVTIASPVATSTVDIGTRGTTLSARSKAIPLNHYNDDGVRVALDITGTCNIDVLITFDDVRGTTDPMDKANWITDANLAGETADAHAQLPTGVTAMLIEFNTYSSGAEVQAHIIEPR